MPRLGQLEYLGYSGTQVLVRSNRDDYCENASGSASENASGSDYCASGSALRKTPDSTPFQSEDHPMSASLPLE